VPRGEPAVVWDPAVAINVGSWRARGARTWAAAEDPGEDKCQEVLNLGRPVAAHAILMMIPEPWENHEEMDPARRAFYRFHATPMEPWGGPACVAFTDGMVAGAVLVIGSGSAMPHVAAGGSARCSIEGPRDAEAAVDGGERGHVRASPLRRITSEARPPRRNPACGLTCGRTGRHPVRPGNERLSGCSSPKTSGPLRQQGSGSA
jgi:hypothetical protein